MGINLGHNEDGTVTLLTDETIETDQQQAQGQNVDALPICTGPFTQQGERRTVPAHSSDDVLTAASRALDVPYTYSVTKSRPDIMAAVSFGLTKGYSF